MDVHDKEFDQAYALKFNLNLKQQTFQYQLDYFYDNFSGEGNSPTLQGFQNFDHILPQIFPCGSDKEYWIYFDPEVVKLNQCSFKASFKTSKSKKVLFSTRKNLQAWINTSQQTQGEIAHFSRRVHEFSFKNSEVCQKILKSPSDSRPLHYLILPDRERSIFFLPLLPSMVSYLSPSLLECDLVDYDLHQARESSEIRILKFCSKHIQPEPKKVKKGKSEATVTSQDFKYCVANRDGIWEIDLESFYTIGGSIQLKFAQFWPNFCDVILKIVMLDLGTFRITSNRWSFVVFKKNPERFELFSQSLSFVDYDSWIHRNSQENISQHESVDSQVFEQEFQGFQQYFLDGS